MQEVVESPKVKLVDGSFSFRLEARKDRKKEGKYLTRFEFS
jgi:hypothetical protein